MVDVNKEALDKELGTFSTIEVIESGRALCKMLLGVFDELEARRTNLLMTQNCGLCNAKIRWSEGWTIMQSYPEGIIKFVCTNCINKRYGKGEKS